MKNVSIRHLQLFEDRSDAACCVVVKTIGTRRWKACGVGMVCAYGGGGARMRIWGKGVCSDVARRGAIRRRVVLKPRVHGGMRGGMACAWRRQWVAFGRDADRNAIPANARL